MGQLLIIKLSDFSRLETVTEADLTRVKKYEKALKRLG